jgi:VWFA-related protein
MIRIVPRFGALLFAATGTAILAAQGQPPTFSTANRTVAVYATVTNAEGRLVPDLTRADFTVEDNGRPQELSLFSNDLQPITAVVLLDRSGSLKPNFSLEIQGAEAFVNAMGPDDRARIGTFANEITIEPAEFTSDKNALRRVLYGDLPTDGPTPLWNAVDRATDKLLLEKGRRVIVVFTDGMDRPMNFSNRNKSLKDVMKRSEEQDVMVYAIGLAGQIAAPGRGDQFGRGAMGPGAVRGLGGRGLGGYSGRQQADMEGPDEGLPKLAAATGGGYFELKSAVDLVRTFARVADELHHQYALGFTPQQLDGKMHDLSLKLSKPGLTARARKRYLASKVLGTP